jgi:tetratricopeptide (TPR) repeat protein
MGDVVSLLARKLSGRGAGAGGAGGGSGSGGPGRQGFLRGEGAATWYARGCQLEADDRAAAIHAYRRAVTCDVHHADAHNNLGRLLHESGDLDGAERSYRLAIAAATGAARVAGAPAGADAGPGPGEAIYWFNLGVVLEDRGRLADAITAYRAALARYDRLADAHFNLARLLERAGDQVSARAAIRHLSAYRALGRQVG